MNRNTFHNTCIVTLLLAGISILSACNRLADEENRNFPTKELSGKIVFARSSKIIIHDFNTNTEKVLVEKEGCHSPRWSPDGKRVLYKTARYLFLINSDGCGDKELAHRNLTQVVCQWLNDQEIIIGSTVINVDSLKSRPSMPGATSTGARYSNSTLSTDSSAIKFLSTLTEQSPVACTYKEKKWFIKYAYPFLLPQKTSNGIRFSLLQYPEIAYNCKYDSFFHSVFVADTNESGILFNSPQISDLYGDYPVWSPDGNYVAVGRWSYLNIEDGKVIYIFSKYGEFPSIMHERYSKRKDWFIGGDIESYSNPRWSPDSRFITCNHHTAAGYKVYIYDMVSRSGIDIFNGDYSADPDWHS